MQITQSLLDSLSSQAKSSPRLRQNYDLRTTPEDNSQRMLNALEPGTVMPIHRHRNTSETVVIIRGSLVERFYDDEGRLTEEVLMVPGGENPAVQIEKGRWHNLECLEPDTVLFEAKDGAWESLAEEDIMRETFVQTEGIEACFKMAEARRKKSQRIKRREAD